MPDWALVLIAILWVAMWAALLFICYKISKIKQSEGSLSGVDQLELEEQDSDFDMEIGSEIEIESTQEPKDTIAETEIEEFVFPPKVEEPNSDSDIERGENEGFGIQNRPAP